MRILNKIVFHPLTQRILRPIFGLNDKAIGQEKIDIYRAALLIKCFEWRENNIKKNNNNSNSIEKDYSILQQQPNKDDVEIFYNEVEEILNNKNGIISETGLNKYVSNNLTKQITKMFENIDIYTTALNKKIARNVRGDKEFPTLSNLCGFELEIRQSKIPGGALGLFVKSGNVFPGTVLAFFPGLVHLSEHVVSPEYMQTLLPDNDLMLMVRMDGHIIDSRNHSETPFNPYGLAHMANHVPVGVIPECTSNVLQLAYDFPHDPLNISDFFPHKIRKYIPNKYAKPPTIFGTIDRSAFMHSMVLIAARPLQTNDEIYMDYRLSPGNSDNQLPSWYIPYDLESSKRRWSELDNSSNNKGVVNSDDDVNTIK